MKSFLTCSINKENVEDIQELKGIISKDSDMGGHFEKHIVDNSADLQSLKFEKPIVVRIVSVEEQTMLGKETLIFRKTERVISNSEVEDEDDEVEDEDDEDDTIKMKDKR
jgi:hypothetical protein